MLHSSFVGFVVLLWWVLVWRATTELALGHRHAGVLSAHVRGASATRRQNDSDIGQVQLPMLWGRYDLMHMVPRKFARAGMQ